MNESMGSIIARKRKELGLTQEQLATALGISFQAVSKWENEISSPDISTLPLLADLFGISVDELFGRPAPIALEAPLAPEPSIPAPVYAEAPVDLPWEDDDTLHAALFVGRRLVERRELPEQESASPFRIGKSIKLFFNGKEEQRVILNYTGSAQNIDCAFDLHVEGEVLGSVQARGDVNCGNIGGSLEAGGDVSCGNVDGGIEADGDVSCGNVSGDIQADGDVSCGNVDGDIQADGDVSCGEVKGSVSAGDDVNCGDVGSVVTAGGDVSCGNVGGMITAGGDVSCSDASDDDFHSNLKGKKKGFSFELKL